MTSATRGSVVAAAALTAGVLIFAGTAAQRGALSASEPSHAELLTQNFRFEHQIGRRFHFDPDNLPPPKTGPIVAAPPLAMPFGGQTLKVPPGFVATPFATGLDNPRRLLVLANGDVLVAEQGPGYLTLLRDGGGGRATRIDRYAEGFDGPYGLAVQNDHLLVADLDGIWKLPHLAGSLRAGRMPPSQPADQVPPGRSEPMPGADGAKMLTRKGVFGIARGHQNRDIAISPKTGAIFVGVGSAGNLGVEPEPKATIQRFDPDGTNQTTYAAGMRNPTALKFNPQTGDLWAIVQERDGLGDDLPSDYLVRVRQGGFYGWPYAYIGKHPQPGFAHLAPDKVAATITPDLLFEAHSSVLDLVFYEGDQFPAAYKGALFVAFRGSWNRSMPTGYKIVLVPFRDGSPVGYYENFATGFWASGEERAEVWGRPAALAVAKDGALLVADDTGGTIWRIAYTGNR